MDHRTVAGALYDFLGFLSSRKPSIEVGADVEATSVLNAFRDFARKRGLAVQQPDISGWSGKLESVAEALITYALALQESTDEFYSVPMDMRQDHNPTTSDGAGGRGDSTNFAKRRKYLDAKEGTLSNWGTGSEKDAPAEDDTDENFGMAGLPGGVRDDPESPNSYDDTPQARLRSK